MTLVRTYKNPLDTFWDGFSIDNVFDNAFSRVNSQEIPLNISEDKSSFSIEAELPGVDKKDISISYENEILSIGVETTASSEEKEGQTIVRSEIIRGNSSRSIRIKNIDFDKAKASVDNGILTINLPKSKTSLLKQLEIK